MELDCGRSLVFCLFSKKIHREPHPPNPPPPSRPCISPAFATLLLVKHEGGKLYLSITFVPVLRIASAQKAINFSLLSRGRRINLQ